MIEVTEITLDTTFADWVVIFNDNNSIIEDAVNSLINMVDTTGNTITTGGLTVEAGANPTTTTILTCQASAQVVGSIAVGSAITGASLATTGNISSSTGNFTLTSTESVATFNGKTKIAGALEYNDVSSNFIDASDPNEYSTLDGTTGILAIENVHAIMLDFSNYDGITNNIQTVAFPEPDYSGQVIVVIAMIGGSGGTHAIVEDNIANLGTGETLQFNADYNSVDLVAVGTSWVYRNLTGVTVV